MASKDALPKFEDLEDLPSIDQLEEIPTEATSTASLDSLEDAPYEEYGFLRAMGSGALQGASFGFADEIEAALRSALGEDYDKALAKSRAQYKMAAEQQPVADLIGNVAGGLPIGLLTGPLGVAAKGASLGKKVAAMAKAGAVGGALYGAGSSEGTLATEEGRSKLAEDIAGGTVGGAAVGAAGQLAGSGLKKVGANFYDLIKNNSYIGDTVKTFQKTLSKRTDLVDDLTKLDQRSMEFVDDFIGELQSIRKKSGQEMGAAYVKALDDAGKTVDTESLYNKLVQRMDELVPEDPEQAKILKNVKAALADIVDMDKKNLKVIQDIGKKKPSEKATESLRRRLAERRAKFDLSDLENLTPEQADAARQKLIAKGVSPKQAEDLIEEALTFKPKVTKDVKTGLDVYSTRAPSGRDPETGQLIFDDLIKAAEPEFTPIKFREQGQVSTKQLTADDVSQLMADINRRMKTATPQERRIYGQMLQDVKDEVRGQINDPAALQSIDEATQRFRDISEAQKALGLDATATSRTPYTAAEVAARDAERQQLLRKISNFTDPAQARMAEIDTVKKEAIPALKRINEGMGVDVEDMFKELSEDAKLAQGLGLESQIGGSRETLYASPKAFMMRGAAGAAKTVRDIQDIGANVSKIARRFVGMPEDEIAQMAAQMSADPSPTAAKYGQMLSRLLNEPQQKRKASMFALLQNADFRKAAAQYTPFGEEEE